MEDGSGLLCSGQAAGAVPFSVPRPKGSSPVFMRHLARGTTTQRARMVIGNWYQQLRASDAAVIYQTLLMHRIKKN